MNIALFALLACIGAKSPDDTDLTEADADTDADSDTDTDADADGDTDSDADADLANGQDVHDMTCGNGYCHGNNTILNERVPELTDEEIFNTVNDGTDFMPAQDQLSDTDITDVIAYLRTIY
jgi:mono/diheme cytochrome c family protein